MLHQHVRSPRTRLIEGGGKVKEAPGSFSTPPTDVTNLRPRDAEVPSSLTRHSESPLSFRDRLRRVCQRSHLQPFSHARLLKWMVAGEAGAVDLACPRVAFLLHDACLRPSVRTLVRCPKTRKQRARHEAAEKAQPSHRLCSHLPGINSFHRALIPAHWRAPLPMPPLPRRRIPCRCKNA